MNSHFQITVKGRGTFPLDMLRYSQVYPRDHESVENIEQRAQYNAEREVTVCMDNNTMGMAMNCVIRFASFGWTGEVFEDGELVYSPSMEHA